MEWGPVAVVRYGRVGVMEAVGEELGARAAVILVGERPGLTVPCSMGVYLTVGPGRGKTDETRNCVSNIHERGLSVEAAAETVGYLLGEGLRLGVSGVGLKDLRNVGAQLGEGRDESGEG